MLFDESNRLRPLAHAVIPGGAHTYAKGDDQFPEAWRPASSSAGSGCHVWDVDGNEFIEYGMGLRSVTLGHALRAGRRGRARGRWRTGINFTPPGADRARAAPSGCCDRVPARRRWSSSRRTAPT